MRHRARSLTVLAGLLIAVIAVAWAGPRDTQWKQVDEAIKKGLPQTAIQELDPIIAAAIQEKAYAEAIKAIGTKISLVGNIQGNKPEEKITRMQAEIDKAPDEMKPVLRAIMANWYWIYFQQNRWRFLQRTQTAAPPGDDFTTWDLPRIFAEIDTQFEQVLADAELLQKIPIGDYDALLDKGNAPDSYRPTLYDFLAQNALEFYASGEQAAARAEDAFDLSANSPIFSSADEFVAWKPETTDQNSPTLKAVLLFQQLLRFHQQDDDRSAFLDADLARLEFGNNKAFGEEKGARYLAALKRFAQQNAAHEISARAIHDWAVVTHADGDWVEAREIARQGLAQYPDSVGGRRCFNLIQQIEARQAQVNTERVWNKPYPTINVSYRNVTKVYFRVVAFDFEEYVGSRRWGPENLDANQRGALLKKPVLKAWSADLPATEDYQLRTEELAVPEDLKFGSYYLIASYDEGFKDRDNQVSFAEFWVSNLALVVRTRQGEGVIEGFVLDALSGEPLSGAKIRGWQRGNQNQLMPIPGAESDKNGMFRIEGQQRNSVLLHAALGDQALSTLNYFYANRYDTTARPHEQTMFFSDRSLYRPGQTIQYKGICVHIDQNKDNYHVIKGRDVTVVFLDVNGKEIERQRHRTNDYGSFSGSVTAPRDRLMGRMTLRVDGQPAGATQVTVEEYKRPKFQVVVDPLKEPARLNGPVTAKGKATSYTGAAIGGAKVRWRVVRQVRFPAWWYWRCWWMPPQPAQSQEIAHGTAITESNGSFEVPFVAKPDLSVAAESEPTFQFTIHADVTDTTGETRTAQRIVNVGYTALSAKLAANDWQVDDKPVEISVATTTLDGEGQSAEGTLRIYRLRQPKEVHRPPLNGRPTSYRSARGGIGAGQAPPADPTNPNSWPLGNEVHKQSVTTGAGGAASVSVKLESGMYRAQLETQDRFGKTVTAELPLQVLDPDAGKLAIKLPNLLAAPKWSVEPGEAFEALWGSGYDSARAFVEIEHRNKLLQSFWTEPGATQLNIRQPIDEALRGGFTLRVTMVRENRAYLESRRVDVPWSNKRLTIQWEHFVSKLQPAQKETWTAVVKGPDATTSAVAELVAALYDASLDAYLPHNWPSAFQGFRTDYSQVQSQFENQLKHLQNIYSNWNVESRNGSLTYRHFPEQIIGSFQNYRLMSFGRRGGMAEAATADGLSRQRGISEKSALRDQNEFQDRKSASDKSGGADGAEDVAASPDLSQVAARQNLNETAFFFPQLLAGEDGTVRMEFTMPEALTEWKFLGFAHDTNLRGGLLTGKTVTAKDLMIQPNPPRFLREGDLLDFTVKVSNQSPTRQEGQVRLTLADAASGSSVDDQLENAQLDQAFDIPSGESKSFSWRLRVPDGLGFLSYKAVGSTGRLSDGEEGYLPVLSRRVLVTESLPLPIRGPQTKEFDFTRLRESGNSDSLKNKSLTVQMVSNPSWYAVMALPYLMEFPHECTEQTFNRLYANSLARHVASSDPKIRRVFDIWKLEGGDTLDSPLEKNQDLKALMLEETPWVRQAAAESQARRNVGILFDENRLNQETTNLLRKLSEQQYEDGRWPWFPGGPANDYITLYITTGFGRMRHLGVELDAAPAIKSLRRLDAWVTEIYQKIPADRRDKNHLSTLIALYLYGRSFFLDDQAVAAEHKEAVDYWISQAKKYWLELGVRQSQGHLAVALKRFGDLPAAQGIMASIKERSVSDEELGMFWRDLELSWWWFRAPIETQAMMIEAFDEVMNDQKSVEDCKVWLLKQKQTQDWKTTKATADAIYALLLRGSDLLASDALVEVSLGGQPIQPDKVEAGTGFFEQRFAGGEIKPEFGKIRLKKSDQGVAWGSVHWQYLEDMSKVTEYEGTPLKLTKQLYTRQNSTRGPVLEPVQGPVAVGDELVVRVVLRTDRDMEYIHLKDYRGSGTEPVNVLSRYKFQDGLYYYESTRDAATHFFIDYLPKGVYVFEYAVRVQHAGQYQTGFASIQCMYAPEFNSHSESLQLDVK